MSELPIRSGDPVTVIDVTGGLVRTRVLATLTAGNGQWFNISPRGTKGLFKLQDEGILWCRGWGQMEGEALEAAWRLSALTR